MKYNLHFINDFQVRFALRLTFPVFSDALISARVFRSQVPDVEASGVAITFDGVLVGGAQRLSVLVPCDLGGWDTKHARGEFRIERGKLKWNTNLLY